MRRTARKRLIRVFLMLWLAGAFAAQGQGRAEDLVEGIHIVRPGETLERLAAVYLGSVHQWRRIHRLNPDIADPDLIEPGQRITVVIRRGLIPAALVDRLSRRVDEQAAPIPWSAAKIGDLLLEQDGLRTYRRSSAEMRFTDGTRLTVTEDSLVFLRRTGKTLAGVEKKSVEIVEGQADLGARFGGGAARPEVELVLGAARSTARPDAAGTVETRARRPTGGGAKVMVYGGESDVESGGASVRVASGMGTSVPEQGPPSPPEPLLAAPALTAPAADAATVCATPLFAWDPVTGAESYIVEVCRDAGCGELVERITGLGEASWRPAEPLPLGAVFWRTTARSRSGLDGYPSPARALAVTGTRTSAKEPPSAQLALLGVQVAVGETLYVNRAAAIGLAAADPESATAAWKPEVDGREVAAWPAAWSDGAHTVAAVVADPCGGGSLSIRTPPLAFVVDGEPPALRSERGNAATFAGRLTPEEMVERRGRRRRDETRGAALLWSTGGVRWFALDTRPTAGGSQPRADGVLDEVRIDSDLPRFFLRAGDKLRTDPSSPLAGGSLLWVTAEDAGSRVEQVTLRTRAAPGRVIVEVEAVDLVGNRSRVELLTLPAHP